MCMHTACCKSIPEEDFKLLVIKRGNLLDRRLACRLLSVIQMMKSTTVTPSVSKFRNQSCSDRGGLQYQGLQYQGPQCQGLQYQLIAHSFYFSAAKQQRSIRFQDEPKSKSTDEEEFSVKAKPTTPLQAAMLKMAAEKAARIQEQSKAEDEEVGFTCLLPSVRSRGLTVTVTHEMFSGICGAR